MKKPLLTEVYSTCALYGLLLWYTVALFPLFPGLDIGPTVTLAFLFWLGTLLAGKLRPLWHWGGFALLAAGSAALAPHLYLSWRWQHAQEGEINLLPRLAAAFVLVWPLLLAAFLLWQLLPRTALG